MTVPSMINKILLPTDLSRHSNSVVPVAVTLAQAFDSKLYFLHIVHPLLFHKPEQLEDFPRLGEFLSQELNAPDLPPLHSSVRLAKMNTCNSNFARAILETAESKQVDLICMAATNSKQKFRWRSTGRVIEKVLRHARCSVLCLRSRALKPAEWKRPRFRQILFIGELNLHDVTSPTKTWSVFQKFGARLHVLSLDGDGATEEEIKSRLLSAGPNSVSVNVLPRHRGPGRMQSLIAIIHDTPIDLVVLSPMDRRKFSNRFNRDVIVHLLDEVDCPVLLVR